jgi:ComEC/Rec2-related protein
MNEKGNSIRRPLLVLTGAWLLGTLLAFHGISPRWLGLPSAWTATAAASALWLLLRRLPATSRLRPWLGGLITLLLLAVILCAAAVRTRLFIGQPRGLPDVQRGTVTLSGRVCDDPDVWLSSSNRMELRRFNFQPDAGGAPLHVRWSAPRGMRGPVYGDQWQLVGQFVTNRYRGLMDDLTGEKKVLAVRGRDARWQSGDHGNPVIAWSYDLRRRAAEMLALGIEEDHPLEVRLLHALLLGYRAQMPYEIKKMFVTTGTMHVIAISGSHVVVMCGIALLLLRGMRISRMRWFVVLAPALVLYTYATGFQPSAIRACVMALLFWLAPLLGRRPDAVTSLAASALLIVGVAPDQLFDLGFLMSYLAVLGLVWVYPVLMRILFRGMERDPFAIEPLTGLHRWGRGAMRELGALCMMSLTAWLVVTPVNALWFGQVSLMALPVNLLVVPLASLVLFTGCMSLLLGACVPFLAVVFNHANLVLIHAMLWVTGHASRVPYGMFQVDHVPMLAMWGWYAALLLAVLWLRARQTRPQP